MRHIKLLFALALSLCLAVSPALAFTVTYKTAAVGNITASENSPAVTIAANDTVLVMGGVNTLPSSSSVIKVTDQAGDTFSVYQCAQTAGSTVAGYVAMAVTTGLSSQTITLTTVGGGNMTAPFLEVEDVAGAATSSPEDTAARACAGSSTSSTSPSNTSGVPSGSNELVVSSYSSNSTDSGASVTETGSWTNPHALGGSTNIFYRGAYLTNSGALAETRNPTTNSAPWTMPITAICPSGGCSAAAKKNTLLFQSIP